MIFTDDEVNLPERLLESLTKDRLVVFAGAGVSMRAFKEQASDTCYPGFKELARTIALRLGRPITETEESFLENGDVDRVLGNWDDQKYDVLSHAAAILQANVEKQRLELHRALLRLLANSPNPRVVTTNFDHLLMRALDAEGLRIGAKWNGSIAPALPPVRRFCGICYLHGRVDEPQDMVLTDKDIGRAYMDEGWALRFAHSIFQRFDILFVGYSLEDPPLRYLSLALEGITERERWALVPDPGLDGSRRTETERDWVRRHVEPIWYPAKDEDYRALERTIDAWGKDNARSFLDRRSFLSEISKSNPNHLKPHELSRAKFFLDDPPLLRDFAKASLHIDWFDTLFSWGHFDLLLKGSGTWAEADGFLVERLIDWMQSNPVELLGRVTEYRTTMDTAVLDQFCRRYESGTTPGFDLVLLRQILEFFRPSIDRKRSFASAALFIKRILTNLLDNKFEDDVFWLLSIALRTETLIRRGINFAFQIARSEGQATESLSEYELRYELRFENQLTKHNVRELFEQVIFPRIGSVGFRLAHFLTLKFMELRSIQTRGKKSEIGSQYRRPAIETHTQNFDRDDPVNFLLDLLRDCWEELLKINRVQAEAIYSLWQLLDDELIERLRIHALTKLVETNK